MRRIVARRDTGCWLWQDGVNEFGYGIVNLKSGEPERAHRVMWQMFYGKIPPSMCVCHHCDVPACCNPDHMFLGLRADNNADMVAKKRARKARGEAAGRAKLTDVAVLAIRVAYSRGGADYRVLADTYGVGKTTIGNVIQRRTWKHLK
jgi:hypothetical protein